MLQWRCLLCTVGWHKRMRRPAGASKESHRPRQPPGGQQTTGLAVRGSRGTHGSR